MSTSDYVPLVRRNVLVKPLNAQGDIILIPWLCFCAGGGFAISDASEKSGLSQWIGDQLSGLENLPDPAILIIVMVLTALVTEVCSNVATANVVLPILITLVRILKLKTLSLIQKYII